MTREQIDDTIFDIMRNDGPDGHVDGHEIITDFIMAVIEGKGEEWAAYYNSPERAADEKRKNDIAWGNWTELMKKFKP